MSQNFNTTQPSAQAMKAAAAICEEYEVGTSSRFCDDPPDWDSAEPEEIAKIIDRETNVGELTEAAIQFEALWTEFLDHKKVFHAERFNSALTALRKALRNSERMG